MKTNIHCNPINVDKSETFEKNCINRLTKKSGTVLNMAQEITVNYGKNGKNFHIQLIMKAPGAKVQTVDAVHSKIEDCFDLAVPKLISRAKKLTKWYRSSNRNRRQHENLGPQEEIIDDNIITTMDPNTVYEIEA